MKTLVLNLLLALSAVSAVASPYPVSAIPAELLKNAHSVLRYESIRFEVVSTRETIETNHYVITILNDKADHWAQFSNYYDLHRDIVDVEGRLYDAAGKELKKMKRKDLHDGSAVSTANLMDDNRYVAHNFYHRVYPYTVEYKVTIKNKSTLFFPSWAPQGGENLSVEKSSYTLVTPADYSVRFKTFNYPQPPVRTTEKNKQVQQWSVSNLPAITRPAFSPMIHEITPYALFGPTDFQMDNYKGNMKDWADFGRFVHNLRSGRDELPTTVKEKVHSIINGVQDPKEKINRLYRYMQQNTRYISIQLGIGGWQPFPASEVAAKGYGDCKALTNYMFSLLKEAGIPSYYTLVKAGDGAKYITEDFPAQQFNHVILSVPVDKDTVWLECTSQILEPGYLGSHTDNRPALLIDENGGKLIRTPAYGIEQNLQLRNIKATLNSNGTLTTSMQSRYTGLQQDRLWDMIHTLSKEKQQEVLVSQFHFATYDVNDFSYTQVPGTIPEIHENLDITVSNYATITGKRLFINPNIFTRSTGRKMEKDTARKHHFRLGYAYRDTDSVSLTIPEGYEPETLPKPTDIKTRFGHYTSTIVVKDNMLLYTRNIDHHDGTYPAESYNELVEFYSAIYKADNSRIVLVKKAGTP